jgi:hypothetical protein
MQGPQGERGLTGATGATGMQGPQGERGLTGATGATGMQGPQGEDGTDGEQGPRGFNGTDGVNGTQGPPGPTEILSNRLYSVDGGDFVNTAATGSAQSLARCDTGDVVLSGSYSFFVSNTSGAFNMEDRPLEPSTWVVQATETETTSDISILAFARCFDNPPAHIP